MKMQVINLQGNVVGDVELDDSVFGISPRKDHISDVIRWQLAKRQAGTHACKGRSDVARTSKKLYRQKGTGNARHGARTANIFRGGGVVFGPTPRSHAFSLNKKYRKVAMCSLLSLKSQESNLVVIDTLALSSPKTAELKKSLSSLGFSSCLFVDTKENREVHSNFALACSNLYNVDLIMDGGFNVYDGVRHEKVIFSVDALKSVQDRLIAGL